MKIGLVISILILGFFLRFNNYDVYPQRGATSDEYAFAFLGVSLITQHQPISWSALSSNYPDRFNLTIQKLYFPMVKPYLDHPPLFGLLVGGWAILFGEGAFTKITLHTIRFLPILLSVISSLLLFLISKKLYNYKTALWALLIYTTTTIFVINSRIVVAEHLITLFLLAVLYILLSKKFLLK